MTVGILETKDALVWRCAVVAATLFAACTMRADVGKTYTETMSVGRLLITLGITLIALGLLVTFAGRLPFRLGRLPGDIHIHGRNSTFYFPLATCLLLSALFSLVMWIFRR